MMERLGFVRKDKIFEYLKKHPLSEQQIVELHIESLGELSIPVINKKEEQELFQRLADVEGLQEYLRKTLVADVKRYFQAATPMEQISIKAAYGRTLYFKENARKKVEAEKKEVSLSGKRYAI